MDFFSIFAIGLVALIITASVIGRSRTSEKSRRLAARLFLFGGLGGLLFGLILFLPGYNEGYPTNTTIVGFVLALLGGLAVSLGVGILIANVASEKGRSWVAFFVLSFFLSPIIIGIVVAAIAPLPGSSRYRSVEVTAGGQNNRTDSVADQIEKLGSLLEKGLITQDEFDEKKRALLGRL